jgi:hypothetical protein
VAGNEVGEVGEEHGDCIGGAALEVNVHIQLHRARQLTMTRACPTIPAWTAVASC